MIFIQNFARYIKNTNIEIDKGSLRPLFLYTYLTKRKIFAIIYIENIKMNRKEYTNMNKATIDAEREQYLINLSAKHTNKLTQEEILTFMKKYATRDEIEKLKIYLSEEGNRTWFKQRSWFYNTYLAVLKKNNPANHTKSNFLDEIMSL